MHQTLRSIFLVCTFAACGTSALGEPLSGAGRPLGDDERPMFDDRSAPSTYKADTAPASTLWFISKETLAMNRFEAVGGADLISTISTVWYAVPNGTTARIFIWQDPTGAGNPRQAVLLHEQDVQVASSDSGAFVVYTLTKPVPVSGYFYVGVAVPTTTFTVAGDRNNAVGAKVSYLGGTGSPPLNAANLTTLPLLFDLGASSDPIRGAFLIRANGAGSTFSYQGRLASAGQNYTGAADFVFTVYDSQEGGNVVGVPATMIGVPVTAGVFSVQIPSDPSWFLGAPDRYLDVQVRTPADGDTYTSITPRQRIGQVPAAMVATVAQSAQSAQIVPGSGVSGVPESVTAWQPAAGGIRYIGGNVGIGTTTPLAALHIVGGPPYANAQIETGYTDGTWLNLLNSSPNGRSWSLVSTGFTNTEGAGALLIRDNNVPAVRAAFLPNGNVGFGTITPSRRVQVKGDGIGFSHISNDGSTEVASYADPNAGTFGTFTNKSLLLLANGNPRVAITPLGRLGVGTTAPNDTLDVRGNIRLGAAGEYQAAAGQAEALSTIRGVLNPDGTIRHGSGFTVTRLALGTYRISWSASPGFSDHPTFVGTAFVASPVTVWYNDLSLAADRSGFVVVRTTNTAGTSVDARFSFTITGPR